MSTTPQVPTFRNCWGDADGQNKGGDCWIMVLNQRWVCFWCGLSYCQNVPNNFNHNAGSSSSSSSGSGSV